MHKIMHYKKTTTMKQLGNFTFPFADMGAGTSTDAEGGQSVQFI